MVSTRSLPTALALALALAVALLAACKRDAPSPTPSPAPTQGSTAWLSPNTLQPGPVRATPLSAAQIARITAVQKTFAEVDSSPLEKWIDDFSRDHDPDREIAIYEAMAQAYAGFCAHHAVSREARGEVYGLVLQRSGATDDEVMAHVKLVHLTREEAREALKGYARAPQPVEVERR